MKFASSAIWRAHEPANFVWEALGAERFLFNPLSGQTHVLNPLGAAVLEALTDAPRSTQALLALLKNQQGDTPTDDVTLENHLHHHLQQLQELGLIELQS